MDLIESLARRHFDEMEQRRQKNKRKISNKFQEKDTVPSFRVCSEKNENVACDVFVSMKCNDDGCTLTIKIKD